ncbi:hypothetical protein ABE583_11325 [Stenotrophomonas sp. TWI143]|uniref:hypothetical protein n=1 Tax=Stenotrophomonas TaxID=40323 RepID=UPI0013D9102B|nr:MULTISPECIES: hypothetical protein [Stenotrophomonas]MBH1591609.1 hypothetical protein [Stenotrophomonas maltophilia]MDH2024297.1 hypothetical protein [Stenotrophomonas sp. GD03680]HDS1218592.1 hypothetical protein [Stenotrophomonas maltophilia]HEL3750866.1 hypothetical protein [Stenotrophomonas maltophilia]HEL7730792.1 hypothetical protein [Stenotrophomonas maltophilia]
MNNHPFRIGAIACVEAPGVQSIVGSSKDMLRLDVSKRDMPGCGRALEVAELGPFVGNGFIDESNAVGPTQCFYFCCCIAGQARKRSTEDDGQRNMASH